MILELLIAVYIQFTTEKPKFAIIFNVPLLKLPINFMLLAIKFLHPNYSSSPPGLHKIFFVLYPDNFGFSLSLV